MWILCFSLCGLDKCILYDLRLKLTERRYRRLALLLYIVKDLDLNHCSDDIFSQRSAFRGFPKILDPNIWIAPTSSWTMTASVCIF
jgi:hypothetical protein